MLWGDAVVKPPWLVNGVLRKAYAAPQGYIKVIAALIHAIFGRIVSQLLLFSADYPNLCIWF